MIIWSKIDVGVIEKLQSKTYLPFLFLSSVCGSRASRALYFSGDVIFKDKQRIIATVSYNGNGLAAFPISIFIGWPRANVISHSGLWFGDALHASLHIGQPHLLHLKQKISMIPKFVFEIPYNWYFNNSWERLQYWFSSYI